MPGFFFLSRVKRSERVQRSKLLLSSTSALCKFYPQLEVSTHRPKINTLQLVYVLHCRRDTQFILTEDTFSLYLQYSMVCCRAQHVRRNKAATYLLHYRWVTGLLSNQFILMYPFLWCHRDMLSNCVTRQVLLSLQTESAPVHFCCLWGNKKKNV